MAESMKGLQENLPLCGSHKSRYRRKSNRDGLGTEEQK